VINSSLVRVPSFLCCHNSCRWSLHFVLVSSSICDNYLTRQKLKFNYTKTEIQRVLCDNYLASCIFPSSYGYSNSKFCCSNGSDS